MKTILGWLKNSSKIKRWILLIIIGMILVCYGFSEILVLERLELIEIAKIVITFVVGFTVFIIGTVFMQRRTLEIATGVDEKNPVVQKNNKAPKVVVIGGGTGIKSLLRGLKNYTPNITAIAPLTTYGNKDKLTLTRDIKDCLIALAKNSEQMQEIINGEFKEAKFRGLTFGDLYLKVVEQTYANFAEGVENSDNILAITGKVLPVTLEEMKICVELDNGMVIEEKNKITEVMSDRVTKINRVYINPSNCRTAPGVIEAIKEADAIIIGPGSLYLNIIPNLLIKNVSKTIRENKGFKIYIPNIMTEPGHTDDYDLSDYINAIIEHAGKDIINYCICDNGEIIPEFLRKYNKEGSSLVNIDSINLKGKGIKIVKENLSHIEDEYIRHNPEKLAKTIIEVICNEMRFKDKQNDEQYLLLNSKLKEQKKNKENVKEKKVKTKKEKVDKARKNSKFSNKYKERIKSIQESEETRFQNIKLHEQAEKITAMEEKKRKKNS